MKKTADTIFTILNNINNNPKTELNYTNHYTLLVAVTLSAQATDISVNKVTDYLFQIIDNPYDMIKFGEDNLKNTIKTIGLYRSKAKNIIAMSNILVELFDGQVPHDVKNLMTLPGVGQKTANVFLNCALGAKVIAVDTHVLRVSNRLNLVCTQNPIIAEKQLHKVIPDKWLQKAHHFLVLHGRYICKARKPLCQQCPIKQLCPSKEQCPERLVTTRRRKKTRSGDV